MLRVQILINKNIIMDGLHAVRVHPTTAKVTQGKICTYNVMYNKVMICTTTHPYGDMIGLTIKILQIYKEDEVLIRSLSLQQEIQKFVGGINEKLDFEDDKKK